MERAQLFKVSRCFTKVAYAAQAVRRPPVSSLFATGAAVLILANASLSNPVLAQQSLQNNQVAPMGQWLEYREANYRGKPVLVHLRTGYERAVVMPEPVVQRPQRASLPGCEILIERNVVAFYPTVTFPREPVFFVGQESGDVYELRVRASTLGMRQPMRINR